MRFWSISFCLCATILSGVEKPELLVVKGAAGTPEYGGKFEKWIESWRNISEKAGMDFTEAGKELIGGQKKFLQDFFRDVPKQGIQPLWVVLIGHGTYNGKEAKFNLIGPDLEAKELAEWLEPFDRPLVVINCSSCSAPFLSHLSGEGRVLITATRSGYERNFCHFGGFFPLALMDSSADLDKDDQTSLLEAWLLATRRTNDFYTKEGRLATEHSLLDDNGDGKGTQGDWYSGLQLTKHSAKENLLPDGFRAHQIHVQSSEADRKLSPEKRTLRDELELKMAVLRAKKKDMKEVDYYLELERLLLEMGRIYLPEESAEGVP